MSLFMLGRYPHDYLIVWNLCLTIPLLTIKFLYYKYHKWHYFFTDFCYYGNTFIYIFLFFYPQSLFMHVCSFAYASGVMAMGIIGFRNSLVLHDIDKMSSLLIHMVPLKMMWSVRWNNSLDPTTKFFNPSLDSVTIW